MSEIIKKTEKLANAIVKSDDFLAMKKAEKKVDSDKKASELVGKVEKLQNEIDQNKENEELKKKMASLQQKMWQNNKIKTFMQKQQNFSKMMSQVDKQINQVFKAQK